MEKEQIHEILEKLERIQRKQLFYNRFMCIFCVISVICCVCMTVRFNALLPELQNCADQAETILTNLESVTKELAAADLSSMVNNINDLVSASQAGVEDAMIRLNGMADNINALVSVSQSGVEGAMDKLNDLDFDVLNKTISDLSVVVEKLARVAKIFG